MSWITIPNEVVKSFSGKAIRSQVLNDDMEAVFKIAACPVAGCDAKITLVSEWQEHASEKHADTPEAQVNLQPKMRDQTVAWLILEMLLAFNRPDSPQRPNLLRRVQRGNDSLHSTELWRRAWNCRDRTEVKLKKEEYDWLHQFLDRKLPLAADPKEAKERKEQGEESQTIGTHLFSLSEDTVRQAFTTTPERRRANPDELEEPAAAQDGQRPVGELAKT